ncbi:leucine rich repeat protein windpipe [Lasioglossum baleicum]|uniref:leucine rich repeat protein windpipe n=1 Tax=Lasioglossum baleicum TaxID=434251 RepID=UPI003FCD1646
MQTVPTVLSLLLIILSCSGWTNGLCDLENGTVARCQELKDVKYIETYHLDTLKAPVLESHLRSGLFDNLTSLRHLDLSGGDLKRIESGCFRNLTNLRSLNLAENHIASLDSGAIQKLTHLHSLNLRKNKLRHLPSVIADLKSLKHLDVQGNPLQCDCATLLVRDLILNKGVKISKKVLCAGPKNMKSTPLFKPDASLTCSMEEQDREMQNDQAVDENQSDYDGSGTGEVEGNIDEEFVDIPVISSEPPKELEIETPAPETECMPTDADCPGKLTSKEEDIFFETSENPVVPTLERKKFFTDALFAPDEGSGGDEEGSGEGSGSTIIFNNWGIAEDNEDETTHSKEESQSLGEKLFDFINVFLSTTAAPETKKDLDLEEEQFLHTIPIKAPLDTDETAGTVVDDDLTPTTKIGTETTRNLPTTLDYSGVEEFENDVHNQTQTDEMKAEEENTSDGLTEVSPAKQSKKGMGSYVVLAMLLAILASLIMFAAYKGDFCRKKRKRGDVENGTEMKDLQKALLDSGNATHPKVVTNGNVEIVPLVEDTTNHEETKDSGDQQDSARSPNGTADRVDPVKPPRKSNDRSAIDENTSRDDSLPARSSPVDVTVNNVPPPVPANGPPLSPGAQRVKITLQENPDSVPKTPILITRTMAGDNLVKSP